MGRIHNPVKNHKAGKDPRKLRKGYGSGKRRHLVNERPWCGKSVSYHHTALRTRQVLLPPKPKELEAATRTGCGRAWLGTWHKSHSGSGSTKLIVGGRAPRSMA